LLVQYTAADVSAWLCIEPDSSGIGRFGYLPRWLGRLRLEQLRLDHAGGYRRGAPKMTGDCAQADDREQETAP
jgi:hypothetical protein